MKKIIKLVVVFSLIFGLTISSSWGGQNPVKAATNPQGGFVAATTVYSGTGQSQQVAPSKTTDLFMNVSDANAYAAKLNSGWKQSIAWATLGWIKGVGPFITVAATVNTVNSQIAASKILKLTSKNKKVHVTINSLGLTISEWNGTKSAIKTSAPPSKTVSYGGITAITKTTINKTTYK